MSNNEKRISPLEELLKSLENAQYSKGLVPLKPITRREEFYPDLKDITQEFFPGTYDIVRRGIERQMLEGEYDWRPIALETLFHEIGMVLHNKRLDQICSIRFELQTMLDDFIHIWEKMWLNS